MATQPDGWGVVKALFDAALELDSRARSAFLRNHCPDVGARAEAERLLSEHDQEGASLSTLCVGRLDFPSRRRALARPNRLSSDDGLAGRYRIVRLRAFSLLEQDRPDWSPGSVLDSVEILSRSEKCSDSPWPCSSASA
jgi:hypothetical protein